MSNNKEIKVITKGIEGCPDYSITNTGMVISNRKNKPIKPYLSKYGYLRAGVRKMVNGKPKPIKYSIHRLVAKAFIPNPDNRAQVNHKDGIKTNNHVDNLEWCTGSENMAHAVDNNLTVNNVPVSLLDKNTGITKEFKSLERLCTYLGVASIAVIYKIRYSKEHPFMGKYVITLDENRLLCRPKSDKLGSIIYIYDKLTDTTSEYPSIYAASYMCGINNLARIIRTGNNTPLAQGYIISKTPITDTSVITSSDKDIISAREKYRSTTYINFRNIKYEIYNYYTKESKVFNSLQDVCKELSEYSGIPIDNPSIVTRTIKYYKNAGQTGILLGLGIRSYTETEMPLVWSRRTESDLICSKNNRMINTSVYRVKVGNDTSVIVIGIVELIRFIRPYTISGGLDSIHVNIHQISIPMISDILSRKDISIEKLDRLIYS